VIEQTECMMSDTATAATLKVNGADEPLRAATATLKVNGADEPLRAATVAGLLAEREIPTNGRGVAVALNGAVVPRAQWETTVLRAGDTVEIVRAMQGG
jgi:sulfur carrier protein